jgi:uncharacterized membrane protein
MAGFAALAFFFPLAIFAGMVATVIVFLVASWRMMRAHETLADATRQSVQNCMSKKGG